MPLKFVADEAVPPSIAPTFTSVCAIQQLPPTLTPSSCLTKASQQKKSIPSVYSYLKACLSDSTRNQSQSRLDFEKKSFQEDHLSSTPTGTFETTSLFSPNNDFYGRSRKPRSCSSRRAARKNVREKDIIQVEVVPRLHSSHVILGKLELCRIGERKPTWPYGET